jgi:type II secretory pathway pseudopilin PulG
MMMLRLHRTRLRRGASGHTLVELLVAASIFLLLLGAGLAVLPMVLRSEPRISERAAHIQQARALIERLTRELRQGSGVESATSTGLQFLTYVRRTECGSSTVDEPAIQCRVTYSCQGGACTRTERNPDGTGSAAPVQLVGGLQSASFTYLPSPVAPEYVTVRLAFPAEGGDDAVTLEDGANLRNAALSG